jgi:bifunctional DNase/RNase
MARPTLALVLASALLLAPPALAGKRGKTAEPSTAVSVPGQPEGFTQLEVVTVMPAGGGGTVLLADLPREWVVPIAVGGTEALSIALRAERRRYERPLTHDLVDTVIRELGGELTEVRIDALRSQVFTATVTITQGRDAKRIDLRASDAIALALGNGLPIWMADTVLAETGIAWKDILGEPPPEPELELPGEFQPEI